MTKRALAAEAPKRLLDARVAAPGSSEGGEDLYQRVIAFGIALSVVGFVLQTGLHLTDIVVFDRGVNSFDADEDYTIASWASISFTFSAGWAAFLLGLARKQWVFHALAALFVFLSLDDFVRMHERVGELGELVGIDKELEWGRVIWPLLLLPLLVVVAMLLMSAARQLSGRASWLLRGGLIMLVFAVVLEAASAALFQLDYGHRSWPYEIEVIFEEGAELVGWIWIATALTASACAALARNGPSP